MYIIGYWVFTIVLNQHCQVRVYKYLKAEQTELHVVHSFVRIQYIYIYTYIYIFTTTH